MWADLAIIPCKASMFEARALDKNTRFVRQAQAIRQGPPEAIAVLSMVGRGYRLTRDMQEAAKALQLSLAKTGVTLRQAYADAPGQSTLVWRMGAKEQDAAEEIDSLFRELLPEAISGDRNNVVAMRKGRGRSRAADAGCSSPEEHRMVARRSLVEGLNTPEDLDPNAVRSFVKQENRPSDPPRSEPIEFSAPFEKKKEPAKREAKAAPKSEPKRTAPKRNKNKLMPVALVPVTVRLRPEIAGALKRASLERQLSGEEVYTQQDLVELALEPWLQDEGYL